MTLWVLYRDFCRVLQPIRLSCGNGTDLVVEVVILRHEVAVLRRQARRSRWSRQIGLCWRHSDDCCAADIWGSSASSRQPCCVGTRPSSRSTGLPAPPGRPAGHFIGTTTLVLRLANENATLGYQCTHGENRHHRHRHRLLKRLGDPESPWRRTVARRSGPTSAVFLAAQAKGLMACDFFNVDTVLLRSNTAATARTALWTDVHPPRSTQLLR